jgi:transglutaminase-like putative cysteine protease
MYSPAEAVWMSRIGSWVSRPDSTEGTGAPDVSAWLAEPILEEDDQYQVRALLADPTIEDLRSAGIEYPDWVLRDYLQIPENIQEQLISLTREITAPYETPYDKAVAITSYLREEIEYEETLTQSPPPNMDPVLWVLFEYRKAFCMYSASAEVLMLRSIGIPARLAVGFVEGAINEADQTYTVTYDNSHAWPEVFFPGIGWVEFEPTGNQTPLIRPETSFASEQDAASFNPRNDDLRILDEGAFPGSGNPSMFLDVDLQSGMNPAGQSHGYTWVPVLAFLLAGILVLNRRYSLTSHLPAYLTARILQGGNHPPVWLENWTRWISLSEVERSFQAVNLSLFWLGHPQPRYITPRERTLVLIQHLPSAQADVTSLLHQYHTELYSPSAAQVNVARSAAIRILVKTWLARLRDSLEILNRRYNQLK